MPQRIPNFLVRKPSRPFAPYSGWKSYKDREIVFHSEKFIERWDAHPEGITTEIDGSLFLNGQSRIFHNKEPGRRALWYGHTRGFLLLNEGRFLINGTEVVCEGEWDDWRSHPEGVVVQDSRERGGVAIKRKQDAI